MKNIFAVYKNSGPTSHDIVDQLRKITGLKRIGHAGTLDPLARGVLVVGVGREATRKLSLTVKKEKEYLATIRLGQESTTDDAAGKKRLFPVKRIPPITEVSQAINNFVGLRPQTPPDYSAVKVSGRPAYKYARSGKAVALKPRIVRIKLIELEKYHWPEILLRVVTGPGVYIRSLARDIGRTLGTGGFLSDLERIRVGDFTKAQALTIEQLREKFHREAFAQK